MGFKEKDLQIIVGNTLRWGVMIALTIVTVGIILHFYQYGNEQMHYSEFVPERFEGFNEMFVSVFNGDSTAIIQLGAILLICTPIARVIFALIGYALEGDTMYVIVSIIILVIIALSVFIGAAEG